MTRIFVQRGSSGGASSSNPNRPPARTEPQASHQVVSAVKDEESGEEVQEQVVVDEPVECSGSSSSNTLKNEDLNFKTAQNETSMEIVVDCDNPLGRSGELVKVLSGLTITENGGIVETVDSSGDSSQNVGRRSQLPPPPPPVPPPKPSASNSNAQRSVSGTQNATRIGPSRRSNAWPVILTRTSPTESRPSSPRSHAESEGYNSADEQSPCFGSLYHDVERERQFEIDIRRVKGLELKKMLEDGNCLFRAVADQVYGDSDEYDLARQLCIDYMERERDHFSQFITEGFTSYCKRKRRDKVYGNNVEIQALSEMYNRPIHIYSYSTEPINIFHGSYDTDSPPIRLSYHHGNHYNSLVDPRRLTVGAGLGFSCLRELRTDIDKDQIKAAIAAQQDQQIDNALLAEGRFYSDLELTEKEIERMVVEISRAEYVADDNLKQKLGYSQSSTSNAEPSSSGGSSGSEKKDGTSLDSVLSSSVQMALSMGFSYLQVMEAYSIFGDDVDSIVCFLLETSSGRRKGKATE